MLRVFLLCLGLSLLPAAAHADTLLVYGDSLSAGYGVPREQSWVSLLARRLQEERRAYKVVNASLTGETTTGGAARIAQALRTHQPSIVLVELGANDGLRGQRLDVMQHNLEAIVAACRRAKARVLLIGMRLPPNYGTAYSEKFRRIYADVARREKVPLVPFLLDGFAEDRTLFQPDAVHPTAQAQPLMLDTVWTALEPMLRK
ncbi:MAG TPA: arylesterase [Burkholderiales bacterium]|jgi:Lysophospholipase L1 and related esterases